MIGNNGQLSIVAFMIAIVIVLLALAFTPVLNQVTTVAMNDSMELDGAETTGMNCTGTTDDFMKAGCLAADLNQLFFIGGLLALAGVIISAKIIFG